MSRSLSGLLLTFASLAAQTPAPSDAPAAPASAVADLADLVAPIREKSGVPALGAAVIVDGKLVALGVDGVRRTGHDEKVTVDDLWHLGSCTKAMTATLLAKLVEAGKLQWTATAAQALPDLAPALNEKASAITLTNLLTHRAGLPGGPPPDLWKQLWEWKGSLRDARTEVCKRMLGIAPEAPLGERFLYSNASYIIAGAIAERAANAAWEDLMRREIFAPLGITSGGFGMPGVKDGTTQPWGHKLNDKKLVAEFGDNPPALGPAGTVHMTLRDWAKFVAVHLGEPGPDGKLLVRAASLDVLHTPPEGAEYACGWGVTKRPWAPGPILSHNGSNTSWYCVAWLAPAAKFAVLVTCNQGEGAKACDDVAAACIHRFRPAKK